MAAGYAKKWGKLSDAQLDAFGAWGEPKSQKGSCWKFEEADVMADLCWTKTGEVASKKVKSKSRAKPRANDRGGGFEPAQEEESGGEASERKETCLPSGTMCFRPGENERCATCCYQSQSNGDGTYVCSGG